MFSFIKKEKINFVEEGCWLDGWLAGKELLTFWSN